MKTFAVQWLEKHDVNVEARTKEEACEKVLSGEYDTAGEAAEFQGAADAVEFKTREQRQKEKAKERQKKLQTEVVEIIINLTCCSSFKTAS